MLITSAAWLEVTPKIFTSADESITVRAHTSQVELLRIHRPLPQLLTRAWAWAEQWGARRKPWEQPGAWGATLLLGLPLLLLGGVAQGLVWAVYQHAYYFVPGASVEQGEIEISYTGSAQTIPVTLEVAPPKPQAIFGWLAAVAAVAGEMALLVWLV